MRLTAQAISVVGEMPQPTQLTLGLGLRV